MIVSGLTAHELTDRLRGAGLAIKTGPFDCRIRSDLPQVAQGMLALYPDFPIAEAEFSDFEISVVASRGILSWLSPQAYVLLRGQPRSVMPSFAPRKVSIYLEWGLNYAIYSQVNSVLILHAAVLERGGRAVVILGKSGAGKSTLCAGLALSGWRLLSDELALVDTENGSIHPIARPVSLKNQSIDVIRKFSTDARFGPMARTKRKGLVCCMRPPTSSVRQMGVPAIPGWLISVRHEAGADLAVENVSRAEAFPELLKSSFNYHNLGEIGFRTVCRMMDQVECRRLVYGNLPEAIAHFDSPLYSS